MAKPEYVIQPIESMPFAQMSYVVWLPGKNHGGRRWSTPASSPS